MNQEIVSSVLAYLHCGAGKLYLHLVAVSSKFKELISQHPYSKYTKLLQECPQSAAAADLPILLQ
jgi:hypothetical protein